MAAAGPIPISIEARRAGSYEAHAKFFEQFRALVRFTI
jgi:hypothetical protein